MAIIIREVDGDEAPAPILWDTIWPLDADAELAAAGEPAIAGAGEWALAGPEEAGNRGGLQAADPLATAIILCLFTDRRRPDDFAAPDGESDRRGWHGDSFDLAEAEGERPLGSLLWMLARAPLDYQTARMAEHFAAEALQPLVDQRLVSRFDVAAEAGLVDGSGRLTLSIRAWSADEQAIFAGGFPIR